MLRKPAWKLDPAMRPPRARYTVRLATVGVTLAAVLLSVVLYSPLRRWDRSRIAARQSGLEARGGSQERSAREMVSVAGADAFPLGERRAVEVQGRPLIVEDYAAFPALGDIDGDGRIDLLLGDTQGFLKVYRNVGGPGQLHLAAPVRFGEFCDHERIPTG
jgi:hypothetical protein